jgi:hypothetical protein
VLVDEKVPFDENSISITINGPDEETVEKAEQRLVALMESLAISVLFSPTLFTIRGMLKKVESVCAR